MKISLSKLTVLSAVLALSTVALTPAAMAGGERIYKVTIANATRGQPVAPSVIATHSDAFHLFDLGPAPEPGDPGYDDYFALAAMAETGYPFHVFDQVSGADGVWAATVLAKPQPAPLPPVILPSESNSTKISASGNAKYLTAVAMLGATNDAVYALQGAALPRGVGDTVHYWANAYDVGSEANDESPETVGALGSTEDNGATGMGIDEGGEGYIHVHSGIHGVGGANGLDPATHDWRNPVVEITIERVE